MSTVEDIIYCGTLDIESDLRKLCDSTEGRP